MIVLHQIQNEENDLKKKDIYGMSLCVYYFFYYFSLRPESVCLRLLLFRKLLLKEAAAPNIFLFEGWSEADAGRECI